MHVSNRVGFLAVFEVLSLFLYSPFSPVLIGFDSRCCGKQSKIGNEALLQQKPLGIRAAPNSSCGRPGAEAAGPTADGCSL